MKQPERRFTKKGGPLKQVLELAEDHPAVTEGRTLFPSTVRVPKPTDRVLKSGRETYKLGDRVTKKKWRGFPVFSLCLEERATCPRSCQHWRDCFSNHMPFADRWQAGPEFIEHLELELEALDLTYSRGFVIRVHLIGDFYSVEYVEKWAEWLDRFKALRAFGYTHWPRGTEIGDAVLALRHSNWDRFAIRLSGSDESERCANTIYRQPEKPKVAEGIVCPAQTNEKVCCGSCALCWTTDANICFVAH